MTFKRRVCFIVGALPAVPCGIGDYTDLLVRDLAPSTAVGIVTTADPRFHQRPGPEVVALMHDWRLARLPTLIRTIRRWKPDVVHIQFPGIGYGRGLSVTLLPVLLRLAGVSKIVLTLHEFRGTSRRWRTRVLAGAAFAHVVVAPDPGLAHDIDRALRWRRGRRVQYIPIGSNVAAHITPAAASSVTLRRAPDETVIGFFGFLRPDKGVETLLEAFNSVRLRTRARLVLVGTRGSDVDYRNTVRSRVDELGIRADTCELDWVPPDELSAVLAQFDVCALPFRDGVTANRTSLQAALAHGLAVVTTDEHPRFDRMTNTEYVRPRDPSALGDAITRAIRRPRLPLEAIRVTDPVEVAAAHAHLYETLASA